MMRKYRTLDIIARIASQALLLAALCALGAVSARAQLSYTSPQTNAQTLASSVACTGSAQNFTPQNLGFTQHYASGTFSGSTTSMYVSIIGVDQAGHEFVLTDTFIHASPFSVLAVSGTFPEIIVSVTCVGGTFTLNYSGTSATSNTLSGSYLLSTVDRPVEANAPEATDTAPPSFIPPYGSTYGTLYFVYNSTAISGSYINLLCTDYTAGNLGNWLFYLGDVTSLQIIPIPAKSCSSLTVYYASGGGGAGTFSLDYVFAEPGTTLTNGYTHITGTTATVVKAGPGVVHSVLVGTAGAGTISLFDLAPAACTATPATNVVSVITEFASAAPPPPSYLFDTLFVNGICAKASAAMDITISAQ